MRAYVTLLSTDNYLEGVLCLALSLRAQAPAYRLHVMVTGGVSPAARRQLVAFELPIIPLGEVFTIPADVHARTDRPRWRFTFAKLAVFELTQFERVVFLDADMLVTASIDHLFEEVHAAAVVYHGRIPPYEHWNFPNTGMMVVHPKEGLGEAIFSLWPTLAKETDTFSEQDLVHRYYSELYTKGGESWDLSVRYNTCIFMLDRICRAYRFNTDFSHPNERTVAVLHFSSDTKPWAISLHLTLVRYLRKALSGQWHQVHAYYQYHRYLSRVRNRSARG